MIALSFHFSVIFSLHFFLHHRLMSNLWPLFCHHLIAIPDCAFYLWLYIQSSATLGAGVCRVGCEAVMKKSEEENARSRALQKLAQIYPLTGKNAWKCIVLYCIVLYCIVLYCIVLYCIVLYCIVLYCIALYHIVLYCIVLYCIVLYCIVLYCIELYCIVLNCIVLYSIVLYCIVLYCIVLYCIVLYYIV